MLSWDLYKSYKILGSVLWVLFTDSKFVSPKLLFKAGKMPENKAAISTKDTYMTTLHLTGKIAFTLHRAFLPGNSSTRQNSSLFI